MKTWLKVLIAVIAVILVVEVAFIVMKELDIQLPAQSGKAAGQETTAETVAAAENDTAAADVPEVTEAEVETTVDPRSTEPTAPLMTFPPVEETQENAEAQETQQTEAPAENPEGEGAEQTEETTDSNELPQVPF